MHFTTANLHIPDGFLSLTISLICWGISILILSIAIARTNRLLGEKQIPLMGIMAAFIFAAQMINFPVAGGTSGHLLGGALAAIVLGPWAAMIVMTAVIAVQALLFQDGGLLVMGANILNMGLLTAAIGYGLYRTGSGRARGLKLALAGLAAWLSVIAGALATSLQLWLSGTSDLQTVVLAMLGIHTLIGLGEALVTMAALAFIWRTRPDLLAQTETSAQGSRSWAVTGILLSLVVVLLAPLASTNPDGLNRVAIDLGFMDSARSASGPLTGYSVPFISWAPASKIAAGLFGVLFVALVILIIGRGVVVKSEKSEGKRTTHK